MLGRPLILFVDAFFASPFDFRCWVALKEKGLDFTASRVMVGEGQGLTAAFKERTITARVPGLQHGDFWLAESMAIVEYLEDAFPTPRILPESIERRARVRQALSFLGSDLPALIRERPAWTIFYPRPSPVPLPRDAEEARDELYGLARKLLADGTLHDSPIAAADVVFNLLRVSRGGEALPADLQALVDAVVTRPSVASYLDHERPPYPPTTGRRVRT